MGGNDHWHGKRQRQGKAPDVVRCDHAEQTVAGKPGGLLPQSKARAGINRACGSRSKILRLQSLLDPRDHLPDPPDFGQR